MNLLLVDDHTLFREGLRRLLTEIGPAVAIHEAASLEAAFAECRKTSFQMVLLDLFLEESNGLDTLDAFRIGAPKVPVTVLSGEQDIKHIRAAIDHGSLGFIPKSHTSDQMIAALRIVLAGGIYLPPNVLNAPTKSSELVRDDAASVASAYLRLSSRQKQVATLLLKGATNKEIARDLGLSEGTVKAHTSAIFQVLGAKNRAEAVFIVARCGITVM
jgi:DNA-binding NarL/FixJ family response regulator